MFVVKESSTALQLVKRQVEAGRFGQLAIVAVNVFWQRPQSYYDQDSWRGTWALDGGALMNQASHYIDLLDWLIGPVESLSASIATLGRDIEAEDTAAMQLRWKNGALGTMAVTMLTYPKNLEGSITILGETGTVKIGGPAVNHIEQWAFADQSQDDALVEKATETTSVYGFAIRFIMPICLMHQGKAGAFVMVNRFVEFRIALLLRIDLRGWEDNSLTPFLIFRSQ